MNFKLKPNPNILPSILGEVDLLDINYYMNKNTSSQNSISGMSNLLVCFNPTLLNILYKYDQLNSSAIIDLTDAGSNICNSVNIELVSDNILKIEADYDLIRSFSFRKSSFDSANATGFVSIDPVMLLDYENAQLKQIFSQNELNTVLNSKLIGVTINSSTLKANDNKNATRSAKLPKYIKHFSILNNKINYNMVTETITDNLGNSVNIDVYTDSDLSEDVYQKHNKSFSVINDSTIGLKFLLYIDISLNKYLIDSNDINTNYHINVDSTNNTINATGIFNLDIYEKIDIINLPVDKLIYVKNIYDDEIIAVAKINNVVNNTLSLTGLYGKVSTLTIVNMDEFVITKIYDLSNFNTIYSDNIFNKMINSSNFIFDDLIFDETDYKIIKELY